MKRCALRRLGRLSTTALAALLAGCAGPPLAGTAVTTTTGEASANPARPQARAFDCADGSRVQLLVTQEGARAALEGRPLRLEPAAAEAGRRYEAGDTALLLRGERLLVTTAGGERDCRAAGAAGPWIDAALRGIDLRAVGHEPEWSLEIAAERWLHFRPLEQDDAVLARNPVHAIGTDGTRRYTARAGERELRVSVREAACIDTMSGERFGLRVTVAIGGRTLRGCGRMLETPDGPPLQPE